MSMNPIETTKVITDEYLAYLSSILNSKDEEFRNKINEKLKQKVFVKGPYLEVTSPFETGRTITDLIKSGEVSREFYNLEKEAAIHRPLYLHQEKAFQKVNDKRNIVVATGTGSGKTESFLYPIFNAIMREKEAGTLTDGVRALLVYPMNALANDQIKRLRLLLANYPDITFGRYTGETTEKAKDALDIFKEKKRREFEAKGKIYGRDFSSKDLAPMTNERISREEIRKNPPHLLITNYAMLEYLLIRPTDTVFFDGELAKNWKFIVLDEAHTYKGATGTEIALLLRRVKERVCGNQRGRIQCLATSATLGDTSKLNSLAKFAEDMFDEKVEESDIILGNRTAKEADVNSRPFTLEEYLELKKQATEMTQKEKEQYLYNQLEHDKRIYHLISLLKLGTKELKKIAVEVFPEYDLDIAYKTIVLLVELGSAARKDENSTALIPARYHLFIKSLEGVYMSFYPKKEVFLEKHEYTPVGNSQVPVFEIANCQHCGQEYIVGNINESGYLVQHSAEDGVVEYFLLGAEKTAITETKNLIDDDSNLLEDTDLESLDMYELCTACGKIELSGKKRSTECCTVKDSNKKITIYKLKLGNKSEANTCVSCGTVSKGGIIKRFISANQASTYVIANSLYKMIPAKTIAEPKKEKITEIEDIFGDLPEVSKQKIFKDETGKKLLVFSDSRQEAAFFAAYIDGKYNQMSWRKLMLSILKQYGKPMYLDELAERLLIAAKENNLFTDETQYSGEINKKQRVWEYILKEFLRFEFVRGLEGEGYLAFDLEPALLRRGILEFTAEETWNIFKVLFNTLRVKGAISFPSTVNINAEEYEPRNREVFFTEEVSEKLDGKTIISFKPNIGRENSRMDYLKRIYLAKGLAEEEAREKAGELLVRICEFLDGFQRMAYIDSEFLSGNNGVGKKIDYRKWLVSYIKPQDKLYVCDKCKKISIANVNGVCTQYRCTGHLHEVFAEDFRNDPYYKKMYSDEKVLPMVAKEHTAQISKDEAAELQTKFEEGKVNVLSCSTTFEMGVDVGQLEAILLRNVPPETANYIQRAGRAGRRTSSTAFAVTYAKRSSHDLHYYDVPEEIINGKIKEPYIELKNEKIAVRHVNSIVLAWFFRQDEITKQCFKDDVPGIVGLNTSNNLVEMLKERLATKPIELIEQIERALNSEELMEKLKIREWQFVERLIGENGLLTEAIEIQKAEFDEIDEKIKERDKNKRGNSDLVRLRNTLEKQKTINFLAKNNIIPRYGFPIDVVSLHLNSNNEVAKKVELSRDLKMAITEFAPGSAVVAGGKLWRSYSIDKVRDKEWPAYNFYECSNCKITYLDDSITTMIDDDINKAKICQVCGEKLAIRKFIIPKFGFSTSIEEKGGRVGENKPKKFYASDIQFSGIDTLDKYQLEEQSERVIEKDELEIKMFYSPQGKLTVLNKGATGTGLAVCPLCGYAQQNVTEFKHKNKLGRECSGKFGKMVCLGHIFTSDILKLEFPHIRLEKYYENKDLWRTLLYAILEGAADVLGISREDIGGCIDYTSKFPTLILFDDCAGGAGHVKQIFSKMEDILLGAYKRVDGHCGCGEETSCYGCLNSYSNQIYHDKLARGLVKMYLEELFKY